MDKKKYTPIDCNFYDVILAEITLGQTTDLQYFTEENTLIETKTKITDIYTQQKEEFVLIADASKIRLDYIYAINGKIAPHFGETSDKSCNIR